MHNQYKQLILLQRTCPQRMSSTLSLDRCLRLQFPLYTQCKCWHPLRSRTHSRTFHKAMPLKHHDHNVPLDTCRRMSELLLSTILDHSYRTLS